MGVKHFWPWLKSQYGSYITTKNVTHSAGIEVDILAIDMNGVIHTCTQKVYEYGNYKPRRKRLLPRKTGALQKKVFEAVCEYVERLRRLVNPKKKLLICIDGVAGKSKISQQRQRRFKSGKERENSGLSGIFDPNCITPGTQFLDSLSKHIDWYFQCKISVDPEWRNLEVIFSNEKSPGEGEHKIFRYLRAKKELGESCCIHGMDADLVMLSLGSPCQNIYLFREDSYNTHIYHVVDIFGIRKEIRERAKVSKLSESPIRDFLLMCYCVGNDFLPQVPGVEILQGGIDALLESYRDVLDEECGYLTKKIRSRLVINKKAFQHFLDLFSDLEEDLINEKLNKKASFFPDEILDSATTRLETGKLNVRLEEYKFKYYENKFPKGLSVEEICHEYLRGMEWVLQYYLQGIPSWKWCYPWDYAPFLSDVVIALKTFKSKAFEQGNPVSPLLQLFLVLPPESKSLLPKGFQEILENLKEGRFQNYYPDEIKIDYSGKRKEWEGIVLLPRINLEVFENEYQRVKPTFSPPERKRDIFGYTFSYVYSKFPTRPIYRLSQNYCKRIPFHCD